MANDRLRELSANATQGKWVRSKHCFQIITADAMHSVTELNCPRGLATYPSEDRVAQHKADVEFMVACVNYVRESLALPPEQGGAPPASEYRIGRHAAAQIHLSASVLCPKCNMFVELGTDDCPHAIEMRRG